jgi:hypothetical protein
MDTDKIKGMNTDSRNSLREATFHDRVHPWISVFIRVKPCSIEVGRNAARGTRMDTDKRRG